MLPNFFLPFRRERLRFFRKVNDKSVQRSINITKHLLNTLLVVLSYYHSQFSQNTCGIELRPFITFPFLYNTT